jgi:hypothetical protein
MLRRRLEGCQGIAQMGATVLARSVGRTLLVLLCVTLFYRSHSFLKFVHAFEDMNVVPCDEEHSDQLDQKDCSDDQWS